MAFRALVAGAIVLGAQGRVQGQSPETASAAAEAPPLEQRMVDRAGRVAGKLKLEDAAATSAVRAALLAYYRDLNAVHTDREAKFRALPKADPNQIGKVQFESDKQVDACYGQFTGALAKVLDDRQVQALKDGMTFDMVPLSFATYQRMFPTMTERQKAQIYDWLVDTRESAVRAGSAETKLDAFRVNKLRMHAYLAAQGFDVETAVKAEEARKVAEKKKAA